IVVPPMVLIGMRFRSTTVCGAAFGMSTSYSRVPILEVPVGRIKFCALMKWELPRLCWGGSQTLRIPGVYLPLLPSFLPKRCLASLVPLQLLLLFTGCDQAPLRGQQP